MNKSDARQTADPRMVDLLRVGKLEWRCSSRSTQTIQ
jgi:hypothetical protein